MKINLDPKRNANTGSLVGAPWTMVARSIPHKHSQLEDYSATADGHAEWLARKLRRAMMGGEQLRLNDPTPTMVPVTIPAHKVSRPAREWDHGKNRPVSLLSDPDVIVRELMVLSSGCSAQFDTFYRVSWANEWEEVTVPAVTVEVPEYFAREHAKASTGGRPKFTITADELDAIDAAQAAVEIAIAKKYREEEVPARLPREQKRRNPNATRTLVLGGYKRR